jgi:hypothetical protein
MPTYVPFLQEVRNYNPNTTTDTLFLRESEPEGPIPGDTWESKEMLYTQGGADIDGGSIYLSTPGGGSSAYYKIKTFISPPVASTTSIPAGTWTLRLWAGEGAAAFNAYMRATVYVWTKADAAGPVIIAPISYNSKLDVQPTYGDTTPYNWEVPGTAVSLNSGDRIVLELWIETIGNTCSSGIGYCWAAYNWNGDGETVDSKIIIPASVPFLPRFGHKVSLYDGIHKPSSVDETQTYISNNKHVECEDCHNVHATGKTKHTVGTNLVSDVLKGVSGAIATYPGPSSYSSGTATKEYEICFKCHSGANTNSGKYGGRWNTDGSWRNVAPEFDPSSNASYHPIAATGNSPVVEMVSDWNNVHNQTMYCSDCHGSDAADYSSASGPHASNNRYMLAPYKKGLNGFCWPKKPDGSYWTLYNGNDPRLFCANCHYINAFSHPQGSEHLNAACIDCHVTRPHGTQLYGLIGGLIQTYIRPASYGNYYSSNCTVYGTGATGIDCGSHH